MSEETKEAKNEKKEAKVEVKPASKKVSKEEVRFDSYSIIKYPLSTEKSLRLMESENKLIFVVSKKANKWEIKKAIEDVFKVKVEKVNTLITPGGEKRAYVRFAMDTPAIDIATNMGLM